MNYSINLDVLQSNDEITYIKLPSLLPRFCFTETVVGKTKTDRNMYYINGILGFTDKDALCSDCGYSMHINNNYHVVLRHLNFGSNLSCVCFKKYQFYCPKCGCSKMQDIPFKAEGHRITKELEIYTMDLLAYGYTNKQVSEITGLCKNVVKEIDLKRLKEKYTINNKLIKPERQAKYLGIDEFKLHDGYIYATHIIDLETGHILWISRGKKKNVVFNFIKHVGLDWMNNVIAVACDMNSDFEQAFKSWCPHIKIVYDYFHIIKNFNEKVIDNVRRDEQKRLEKEGDKEGIRLLKKTRYILTSSRDTLKKKDKRAKENNSITVGNELFNTTKTINLKDDYEERYDEILKSNELFLVADIIKERLKLAYQSNNENEMAKIIIEIADLCYATKNKHFIWFAKLLISHQEGIITHVKYKISTGKIEGINNKIKTLRRQAYGYPDDEYFFLKIFDASRR